jgi:hypothetical protein
MNPGTPDGRQGGEDIATAVIIDAIPFTDTGNTSDNLNDYDEVCPYGPHSSPDVVYSYTASADMIISVDLCGSGYDTKTFIYDSSMNVIGCNDDFYFDDTCGVYVSFIEEAYLVAGETYYIVIDGYGGDAGDYLLVIQEEIPIPPCILDCANDDEGEPAIVDGYEDDFNGGCNSIEFGSPFTTLHNYEYEFIFCGQAGWYISSDGGNVRDTDWIICEIGSTGIVEWTLEAEQETNGFLLGPNNCDNVAVVQSILVDPCDPQTMTIQGSAHDIIWLWVGASTFEGPVGADNEYLYICSFLGLHQIGLPTEKVTFDGIKSLYR